MKDAQTKQTSRSRLKAAARDIKPQKVVSSAPSTRTTRAPAKNKPAKAVLPTRADDTCALLNALTDSYLLTDTQGIIIFANTAFAKRMNKDADELVGVNAYDLLPPGLRQSRAEQIEAALRAGLPAQFVDQRDGLILENTITPIQDKKGQITRLALLSRNITERKKAETAFHHNSQIMETIFENTHLMVAYMDAQFNFIRVNRSYAEDDGLTPEYYIGKNQFELYPNRENEIIYRRVVESGEMHSATEKLLTYKLNHTNRLVYHDWTLIPVKDKDGKVTGLLLTVLDVTERKRAEDTLREVETRYRTLFEQSPYGILLINLETGKAIDANAATYQQLGYTQAEFAELGISDYEVIETPEEAAKHMRQVALEGSDDFDTLQRAKNGEIRNVHVWTKLLESGNHPIAFTIFQDITERKKIENDLLIKDRAIASSIVGTSFTDINGKIIYSNEAWLNMFGYESEAQIIGTLTTEYTLNPADANIVMQALATTGQWIGELTGKRRDGSAFEFQLAANMVYNKTGEPIAMLGSFLDITERKQTEDALKRSEALLNESQRISHIGSWELNLRANRLTWSDEIYRIFEIDPQAFGASYDAFLNAIHPDDRQAVNDAYTKSVETKTPYEINHRLRMPDGRVKHVHEQSETFYDGDGNPIRSIGTVQDITERRLIEQEREKFLRELEAKNAELERFTYTVSHDLKSPLVTIKGYLGFLDQDIASGNIKRAHNDMERIGNATNKMEQLLKDLLELSRVGRLMNPSQDVPFEKVVYEALEIVHGQLAARSVAVQVQTNLPIVHGDRQRLTEVLQNLIDNAAKYMGAQPDPRIEIGQSGEEHGKPIFYVKDNGMGIAPEYHERIFGLFNKLDAESEGTGIGLALVKRIIEVHGGRIWIESEPGKGAAFYFTLPYKQEYSD